MSTNNSEADVLQAKVQQLEIELRREKERGLQIRQLIFPPMSDEALNELLQGVSEGDLLGPDKARAELEALLNDDDGRE